MCFHFLLIPILESDDYDSTGVTVNDQMVSLASRMTQEPMLFVEAYPTARFYLICGLVFSLNPSMR